MKPPKSFPITVEGVGTFEFRWRDMAAHLAIEAEISMLTGGQNRPSANTYRLAETAAIFKVLLLTKPDGWDFNALDPTDEKTYEQLVAIREAHATAEATFRGRPPAKPSAVGEGSGQVEKVLVPETVRSGAD